MGRGYGQGNPGRRVATRPPDLSRLRRCLAEAGRHPFTEVLTETPKYVASTTLVEPLPWENSILLNDSMHQVPDLKLEKNLVILGSGDLIQSLGHAG
jgi:hypothetical protein